MINIRKIGNCFGIKVKERYYLFNLKKKKVWVTSEEDIEDISEIPEKTLERLIYNEVIEEDFDDFKVENKKYNPIICTFLMSTICNLQCNYCYAYNNDNIFLDFNKGKTAVDFIVKNALERKSNKIIIKFHGIGEPTLNWDNLVKVYEYSKYIAEKKNLKLYASITTNGVLSLEKRIWLSEHMNHITVSFDGFKEVQDVQRPYNLGSSYDEVMKSIRYFISKNTETTVRTTVTNLNVNHLENWTKFLNELGVKRVNYEPVCICGKGKETNISDVTSEDFIKNYLEALEISRDLQIEVSYSGVKFHKICRVHCGGYGGNFVATPHGTVSACYEIVEKKQVISDIFIIGNYNNEKVNICEDALLELKNTGNEIRQSCNNCFAQYHCGGGCISKRLLREDETITNSLNEKCKITRRIVYEEIIEIIAQGEFKDNEISDF